MGRTLGILVGGGPAPGINAVVEGATMAALKRGWRVVGIPRGFSRLMKGDVSGVVPLDPRSVEGIETRGGTVLGTSRANPTKKEEGLRSVVSSLQKLSVTDLLTIGGDDTATSAASVVEFSGGAFRTLHVPKTIDNDLPLPEGLPTFGFETAKEVGARIACNLLKDAESTSRFYLVTCMGRSAGHLAQGIALASGAHLVLVPEEFPEKTLRWEWIADAVEGAIGLRRRDGFDSGLFVLAEGLLDRLDPSELSKVGSLERDEHGNPRLSEIDLGRVVRDILLERFQKRGIEVGFITKLMGYELRSADPIAFDVQYGRTLGAGAVELLERGISGAMVVLRGGRVEPLPLSEILDPKTRRVRVRRLDLQSPSFKVSLTLQARPCREDFEGARLEGWARALRTTPEDVRRRFSPFVVPPEAS